jgi:hypothetical protein
MSAARAVAADPVDLPFLYCIAFADILIDASRRRGVGPG